MYDHLKKFRDKIYTGMKVGGSNQWNFSNGKWTEIKEAPNRWKFEFQSIKTRVNPAPQNVGAQIDTKFHWYIVADQIATKLDSNSYKVDMNGLKFKVGHKRPHWRTFSYNYPEQLTYKEKVIEILEKLLKELKSSK
ncbi:MAG: hypothetical protein ACFE78_13950 [Candidatus Hodarchaeota archaeon]